jgi:hypothetical protein
MKGFDAKAAMSRVMQKTIGVAGAEAKAAYLVVDFGEHGILSSVWRDDKDGFERIGKKVFSDFPQVEAGAPAAASDAVEEKER